MTHSLTPLIEGKLGEQIAARLEQSVRAESWPAGHYLGHEEALARAFGTSRATIREAIAIAEWSGVVERRRGRDGGLYVCAKTADPQVALLRNYMFLSGASLTQLLRARRIIEGLVLERVIERIGAADAEGLAGLFAEEGAHNDRVHLDRLKRIVDRMNELAQAPLLWLFGGALRHCFVDRMRTTTLDDEAYLVASRAVARYRRAQVQAICDYDRDAMRDLQTRAMDVWAAYVEQVPAKRLDGASVVDRLTATGDNALIYEFVQPAKKAEAVARAIAQTIANKGVREGERLGTEAELMTEYGVSRRMFREGARILERFGIVEQGRGKSGGLRVGSACRDALLTSLQGSMGAYRSPDQSEWLLLGALLPAAMRALMADQPAKAAFLQAAKQPLSSLNFATLLARHTPDGVTGTLIEIAVAVAAVHGSEPMPSLPAETLAGLLDAIATEDRFAAPRIMESLYLPAIGSGAP